MKMTADNINKVADRSVFFVQDKEPYVLIEHDKHFFFTRLFAPYKSMYKGKKRDVVIFAAMRDHEVYTVNSIADMNAVLLRKPLEEVVNI
jgi:hypothetical protein